MPVRKFRSIEDMPDAPALKPLDPDNLRIACELSELAYALHPWKLEPGVRKFRSIEEMSQAREEQEKLRVRRSPTSSTLPTKAPGRRARLPAGRR